MDLIERRSAESFWHARTYAVKVRGRKYLWGSAGITQDLTFPEPLVLQIANDLSGQPVAIGIRVANGTTTAIGTIQAGECFAVPVNNISGVYAESVLDSLVHCRID